MTQQHAIQKALKDFRNFLFLVWVHLNLPPPTLIQYDIAAYLQHGPKRRILEAFRGVGKSWITSANVVWRLLRDPQERILVVSASKERADSFSLFTKRLISEMPILQHLQPKHGQRDSNIAFDVGPAKNAHAPSVKSVGITGQITGSRATIIIADDVEVMNNSATQMQREKLALTVREFDAVIVPGGEIIYLGTPQTEESIYNTLPERGYEIRIWPARMPTLTQERGYNGRLAPYIASLRGKIPEGASIDSKRFSDLDLTEREASWGRSGFNLQFMLDTSLSDADRYPLKCTDLVVMNIDNDKAPAKIIWGTSPEQMHRDLPLYGFAGDKFYRPMWVDGNYQKFKGTVMAIDPSGRGGDETGYAVVKCLNGVLFVVAAGGIKGGYEDNTLQFLADLAKRHKVNHIIVESNFGDGMFTKLLTPFVAKTHPCTIEEVRHNKQKEMRIIDTLEPVMNQHRLVMDVSVILADHKKLSAYPADTAKQYSLFYQLTHITRQRGALAHDDCLDALSIGVSYWLDAMSKDTNKAADEAKEEATRIMLDDFIGSVFGIRNESHCGNWYDN